METLSREQQEIVGKFRTADFASVESLKQSLAELIDLRCFGEWSKFQVLVHLLDRAGKSSTELTRLSIAISDVLNYLSDCESPGLPVSEIFNLTKLGLVIESGRFGEIDEYFDEQEDRKVSLLELRANALLACLGSRERGASSESICQVLDLLNFYDHAKDPKSIPIEATSFR